MASHAIYIGKIFDIHVRIDQSWFIMFVFLSWLLAGSYFPYEYPNQTSILYWIMGIVTSVLFFITVLLHEVGHALTARKFNLISKSITLFVFGGIADIQGNMSKASVEFFIALAGPLTNLFIALLLYYSAYYFRVYHSIYLIITYLAYTNLLLALFNLLPAFPLDGGRVFRAIIWKITNKYEKATHLSLVVGRFIALLFIMTGLYFILRGNIAQGLWIAFIGWFLETGSTSQIQHVRQ